MLQPTLFTDNMFDDLSVPEKVAIKYGFDLPIDIVDGVKTYRLHSWLTGLVDKKYANMAIRNFRRPGDVFERCVYGVHTLQELDSRNREQDAEYVTDTILYGITQDMVIANERVTEVRQYLSESGAFVDWAKQNPDQAAKGFKQLAKVKKQVAFKQSKQYRALLDSGYSPDEAERWLETREKGKRPRSLVTDTWAKRGGNVGTLTDEVNLVVTGKRARDWRKELRIKESPRNHFSTALLMLIGVIEGLSSVISTGRDSYGTDQLTRDIYDASNYVDIEGLKRDLPGMMICNRQIEMKQNKLLKDGK